MWRPAGGGPSPGEGGGSLLGWTGDHPAPFEPSGGCPDGLSWDASRETSQNQSGSWYMSTESLMTVDSVQLTLEGGDTSTGIEYRLIACTADVCAPPKVLPVGAPTVAPVTAMYDIPGTRMLRLRAICTRPSCAPAAAPKLHDFVFTASDTSGPNGYVYSGKVGWTRRQDLGLSIILNDFG